MIDSYASEKEKIVFDRQQMKPSIHRRWVFAFSVALLISQTFLYTFGIPVMMSETTLQMPNILPEVSHLLENMGKENIFDINGSAQEDLNGATDSEEAKSLALQKDIENGLLFLVNKQNAVTSDYKPSDLEGIKYYASDRAASSRYMRAEAARAFNQLSEGAAQQGYKIVVTTAYRSYEFQSTLYNNYVANYGQAEADTFSAQPGKSEHQTGLAADVSSPSVDYQLKKTYIDSPEGQWLNDNAHKYGFIIRFPEGKEEITGYMYEPWHIRYVGKTAAEEIYTKGITLEEYLENYL